MVAIVSYNSSASEANPSRHQSESSQLSLPCSLPFRGGEFVLVFFCATRWSLDFGFDAVVMLILCRIWAPCWWELAFSGSASSCCRVLGLDGCPVVAVAVSRMQIGLICVQEVMGLLWPRGDGGPLKDTIDGVSRAVPAVVLPPCHHAPASTLWFAFSSMLGQSLVVQSTSVARGLHVSVVGLDLFFNLDYSRSQARCFRTLVTKPFQQQMSLLFSLLRLTIIGPFSEDSRCSNSFLSEEFPVSYYLVNDTEVTCSSERPGFALQFRRRLNSQQNGQLESVMNYLQNSELDLTDDVVKWRWDAKLRCIHCEILV